MKNKIICISLVLLIAVFLPTVFVSAENTEKTEKDNKTTVSSENTATVTALQALIEQLQQQIKDLQDQLAKLKSEVAEVKEELKLTKTLRKGLSDDEVKELQKFLSQFREIYPEGLLTGYYGSLTENAVKKFQQKYGIPATGLVGPLTREKINEFLTEEEEEEKITICHIPPGNPSAKQIITIGKSALDAHLAHGDIVGTCPQEPTPPAPSPTTPPLIPIPTPAPITEPTEPKPTPALVITLGSGCGGVTSITDPRDTNDPIYDTVEIGTQCWLKRSLNIGTYVTDLIEQSNNGVIEKYCYGNITANCNTYGGLYQYDEAINYYSAVPTETDIIQGICPFGWHIPRDSEWNALAAHLGGERMAGGKMKAAEFARNIMDDNSSGFTAYGAGRRDTINRFFYQGSVAFFWSSLPSGATSAVYRHINSDELALHRVAHYRSGGISVRCLKN